VAGKNRSSQALTDEEKTLSFLAGTSEVICRIVTFPDLFNSSHSDLLIPLMEQILSPFNAEKALRAAEGNQGAPGNPPGDGSFWPRRRCSLLSDP